MNAKAAVNDAIKTIIDATLIPMVKKKIKVNVMRTFRLIQMNFFKSNIIWVENIREVLIIE